MSADRSIRRLASFQVLGKGASLLAQLLTLAALTRAFVPEDFGAFAAGWALMLTAVAVAEFGIPMATILELAGSRRQVVEPAALGATVLTTAASIVGGSILAVLLLDGLALATSLALVPWVVVGRFRALGQAFAQAKHHIQRIVKADLVVRTCALGGAVIAWSIDGSSTTRLVVVAGAMVLGEVLGLLVAWERRPEASIDPGAGLSLLRRHRYLGLVGASSTAHTRVDQIMFGSFRANAAGGVYALAYRLIDAALALVVAAAAPLLPILRSAESASRALVSRSATAIAGGLAFVAGSVLFIAAEPIVLLVAGNEYRDSVVIVRVLVAVLILAVVNMPLSQLAIVLGATATLFQVSMAGVVSNIALNVWLIPAHGATGAAIATLMTELAGVVAMGAIVHHHQPGAVPVRPLLISGAFALLGVSVFLVLETASGSLFAGCLALPIVLGAALPIRDHLGVFGTSPAQLATTSATSE